MYLPEINKFENTVKGLFNFYHYSPKQRRDLKNWHILDISNRFDNFFEPPISYFETFDITRWPAERNKLVLHGVDDVTALFNHFSPLFTEEEVALGIEQYTNLKSRMKDLPVTGMYKMYQHLLTIRPHNLHVILKLVDIMFTISCSTATCERCFSHMKQIKTANRSCL
ncbi:uncharacterized protein LOC144363010, partial [Saccoglossus kowalevskii]